MYRRKRRFFHSILFRISIWILALGVAGMLLVTYFVKIEMRRRMEEQITEELLRVQDNSLLYVQQTLLLKDSRIDADGFAQYQNEIAKQLEEAGYQKLLLCDPEGNLLWGDEGEFAFRKGQEDFWRAKGAESAYTIHYGSGDTCQVYFSMPVTLKEATLGLISCFFDYGELYAGQLNTVEHMVWITGAVFAAICLVMWLTIYRTLSPIRNLSRATSDVSVHLPDGPWNLSALGKLQFSRRRDEIGELSSNYMEMLQVIGEQFEKIQEDKDRILTLWRSRQEFYNNMTHELKTPLTTISGYAQLMEKNGPGDEALFYKGTEHILQESTRLHRMVVQLLELQDKADQEETRRLNLSAILKSVAETMEIKAGHYGNTLQLEIGQRNLPVFGREDEIRQVLINVIDNAIKYGEPGKAITLQIFRYGPQISIAIANQGPGVSPKDLEMIFEPFYRADKKRSRELGSSGLGLAISARIMEEHQGSIRAKSVPGGETVFTICFPAADREVGIG